MIEKDIYTIENLTLYVESNFYLRANDTSLQDVSTARMAKDTVFYTEVRQLFKGMEESKVLRTLKDCYKKWIKDVDEMDDIEEQKQQLDKIGFIFQELFTKTPYYLWLKLAIENNKVLFEGYLIKIDAMLQHLETPQNEVIEPIKSPVSIEFKPIFKPDSIPQIFDILKDFFALDEQPELKTLLKSGGNVQQALLFLDNGSRLADTFKQLIDVDIITGCNKKELENWISQNFRYKYRNESKAFTLKYLNEIISTNKDKCKKPIIDVKKDRLLGNVSIIKQ